jgi:hypothetical protein
MRGTVRKVIPSACELLKAFEVPVLRGFCVSDSLVSSILLK